MSGAEWFVIGGIIIAALDQVIHHTPWRSNNIVQLIMTCLKAIFRVRD